MVRRSWKTNETKALPDIPMMMTASATVGMTAPEHKIDGSSTFFEHSIQRDNNNNSISHSIKNAHRG